VWCAVVNLTKPTYIAVREGNTIICDKRAEAPAKPAMTLGKVSRKSSYAQTVLQTNLILGVLPADQLCGLRNGMMTMMMVVI
jgi:hypothetical protein